MILKEYHGMVRTSNAMIIEIISLPITYSTHPQFVQVEIISIYGIKIRPKW